MRGDKLTEDTSQTDRKGGRRYRLRDLQMEDDVWTEKRGIRSVDEGTLLSSRT